MDATHKPSAFMGLPGEVRNRIYRLVVLEDEVQVDATGMTEPGLLGVCKEIRKEAGPIFYAENTFGVSISNYDPTAACSMEVKIAQVVRDFKLEVMRVLVGGILQPHWPNLLRWLRKYHGRVTRLSFDGNAMHAMPPSRLPSASIIYAMFRTVNTLRDKGWVEVEELMMHFQGALEVAETGWLPRKTEGEGEAEDGEAEDGEAEDGEAEDGEAEDGEPNDGEPGGGEP